MSGKFVYKLMGSRTGDVRRFEDLAFILLIHRSGPLLIVRAEEESKIRGLIDRTIASGATDGALLWLQPPHGAAVAAFLAWDARPGLSRDTFELVGGPGKLDFVVFAPACMPPERIVDLLEVWKADAGQPSAKAELSFDELVELYAQP